MKLNIFDSHTHTDNSPDGIHSLSYMCEQAIANGIMGFAVTDKYDCDSAEKWNSYSRIKQSVFSVEKTRAAFDNEIRVTKGIELGQGHLYPIEANRALSITQFDFVIGAVHSVTPGVNISEINFNDPSVVVSNILDAYYRENLEMARWNRFDSLAHLGYPERFIWGKYRIPVNLDRYADIIDEILKELIKNSKSLEINTASFRSGLGKPNPEIKIIERYRELGGELVTIGSGSYRAELIGDGLEVAMDMLWSIGFRYFAFYSKREPVMLKIF